MIVSDIYEVLNVIELIIMITFTFFLFYKNESKVSCVIKLITSAILVIINSVQISMQISMGKPYTWTIVLITIWMVDAIISAYSLGKIH